MNPYQRFASDIARLVEEAKKLPLGGFEPAKRPELAKDARTVLFFSPHPDDECISGGPALRLLREAHLRVINVAVTQGSNKARQAARWEELRKSCNYLGFELVATGPGGLERINPKTRHQDPVHWASCVGVIRELLEEHKPKVIFFPHDQDWNSTHIGVHHLVMDALGQLPPQFECYLMETEFWGQMDDPNLTIEISTEDLGDMITATTFHKGEIERNPYHLLLAPWMMDNVRRGGELVGGQGNAAPGFMFAALNRLRRWHAGKAERFFEGGRHIGCGRNIGEIFE